MDMNRPISEGFDNRNETPSNEQLPSLHDDTESGGNADIVSLQDPEPEQQQQQHEQEQINEKNELNVRLNIEPAENVEDLAEKNEEAQESVDQTSDDKEPADSRDTQLEQSDLSESEEKPKEAVHYSKQPEIEVVQQKKELVKRKAKIPNKFADGNLIPEEGDEEQITNRTKSPVIDPISQNLDDDKYTKHEPDLLAPTTPDKIDLTIDEEYPDVEMDVKLTREELVAKYQAAIEERDRLQNTNTILHHRLADYYRKRKSEDSQNQALFDKSSQEHEQRYLKYLSTIEGLRKQMEREKEEREKEIDDLKRKCDAKQILVNEERIKYSKIKRDAASKSISIQTGKQPTLKEIDDVLQREQEKELEVINVRLENLKLKNQQNKIKAELKAREEFGEGLHMIDYEQLKIENQTYNEKIEERNEELMKLKKKINNTVQILTHVKEKLKFVLAENDKEKHHLGIYDEQVKKKRDILNKIKQSRDSLRMDNARLRQNSGLLGNGVLLRDFEECVDRNDDLEAQIEQLKRKHAELIISSKTIKQKISQAKMDK